MPCTSVEAQIVRILSSNYLDSVNNVQRALLHSHSTGFWPVACVIAQFFQRGAICTFVHRCDWSALCHARLHELAYNSSRIKILEFHYFLYHFQHQIPESFLDFTWRRKKSNRQRTGRSYTGDSALSIHDISMDYSSQPRELPVTILPPRPLGSSVRVKNDRRWNSHKDEIYGVYMRENNSLRTTMRMIEEKYGFRARLVLRLLSCLIFLEIGLTIYVYSIVHDRGR